MNSRLLVAPTLVALSLSLSACGGSKPKKPVAPDFRVTTHAYDYSTGWIDIVGSTEEPTERDCTAAYQAIEADRECQGRACKPVSGIAKDFLARCGRVASSSYRAEVARVDDLFKVQVQMSPNACTERVERWLKEGCGEDGACEPSLQRLATRCNEKLKSPLLIHMLENLIERSLTEPRRVKLDTRSCDFFAEEMRKVGGCDSTFNCEDALPKIAQYELRCGEGPHSALPIGDALVALRIELGAGRELKPRAILDKPVMLPAQEAPLALVFQGGAVLSVCGESPKELSSYLAARKACDKGELTAVLVSGAQGERTLKYLKLPHPSDAAFLERYPTLVLEGEADARRKASLETYEASLKALTEDEVTAGNLREHLGAFLRAYEALPLELRRSKEARDILAARDDDWGPFFRALGDAKVKSVGKKVSSLELVGFARRGLSLAFADIDHDGNIKTGARNAASSLNLEEVLPLAFAEYTARLAKLEPRLRKAKVEDEEFEGAASALATAREDCTSAAAKYKAAQEAILGCAAVKPDCEASVVTEALTHLHEEAAAFYDARARAAMFAATLPTVEAVGEACDAL